MSDIVVQRDLGSLTTAKIGSAFATATAGGAGDATAVAGIAIDRLAGNIPLNAEILLAFTATLAATKTLSIGTVKVEQSADGANWDATAYKAFTDPGIVATGQAGGSTEKGVVKLQVDLRSAKRFVRFGFTPDLSASGTDTATAVAIWNLAGFDRLPAA